MQAMIASKILVPASACKKENAWNGAYQTAQMRLRGASNGLIRLCMAPQPALAQLLSASPLKKRKEKRTC